MMAIRRAVDRARSNDAGFSLVEALVAMVIFGTAMSVLTSVVLAMSKNTRQAQGVSLATDQTRLAFQRLDKQVRYAHAITTPGPGVGVGLTGHWYVELSMEDPQYRGASYTGCTGGLGVVSSKCNICYQWRLLPETRRLQTRQWEVVPGPSGVAKPPTPWRTVATGVMNDPATQPPFTAPLVGTRLHQELTVDLQAKRSDRPLGRAQLKGTFFARNTNATTTSAGICHGRRSSAAS